MSEKKYVRVKPPATVLRHPDGYMVTPDAGQPYSVDDPLVKAFPWQFASDDEIGAERDKPAPESVPVEKATRAPGERRPTRRGL